MKEANQLKSIVAVFDYFEKYENKNVAFEKLGNNKVELAQLFCRSSIFKAVDDGVEIAEIIHHVGKGIEVEIRPISLSQDDLDVLLILIDECSKRDCYKFTYSINELLKRLGKRRGSNSVKKVKMHLKNLSMFMVHVETNNTQFAGSLLRTTSTEAGIIVDFYEELMSLFNNSTHVNLEHRFKLKTGMAKFIYNWVVSSSIPVKLELLKKAANRDHRSDVKHKADVKDAMNEIKNLGIIISWHIDIHERLSWIK